jgi:hypothetical protein
MKKNIYFLLVIAFFYLNGSYAMEKDDMQKTPDFHTKKEQLLIQCKIIQFPKPGSPRTPDEFLATEELKALLANNLIKIEDVKALLSNNSIKTEKLKKDLLANNLIKTDDNLLNNELKLGEENSKLKLTKVDRSLGKFARCPAPESPRESECIAEELRVLNVNNLMKKEIEVDDSFSNDELTVVEGNKLKLTKTDGKNIKKLAYIQATLKSQNVQVLKTKKLDSSDSQESSRESSREPSPEHPLNNSSDDCENS